MKNCTLGERVKTLWNRLTCCRFFRVICLAVIVIAACFTIAAITAYRWNDGKCRECGGTLEYVDTVRYGQKQTWYLFECDLCGSMEEFSINMKLAD